MGAALAGSDRPFVLAGGMIGLNLGGVATENDGLIAPPRFGPIRPGSAPPPPCWPCLSAASVCAPRCSVSRRPFTATETTASWPPSSASPVSGAWPATWGTDNRWPAVHRSDAARLARLAVEAAPAGSVLHAVGEEGVPFREIAEAMGHGLGVPTASVNPDAALEHFSFLGLFAGLDSPASAAITRDLLGWDPTGPGLLEDLEKDYYYREA